MVSGYVKNYLMEMLQCEEEGIPTELIKSCGRIEQLIQRVKPGGSLNSTQVLASIVERWEKENQK